MIYVQLPTGYQSRPNLETIAIAVCHHFGVLLSDLQQDVRTHALPDARIVFAYLACDTYQHQTKHAARFLNRNLTNINRARNRMKALIDVRDTLAKHVALLQDKISRSQWNLKKAA